VPLQQLCILQIISEELDLEQWNYLIQMKMDQKPNRIGTYELVGFTKLDYNDNEENQTEFNTIERRFCGIFTTIENYSSQAILNWSETIEVPNVT
jgi:hypothetical protein